MNDKYNNELNKNAWISKELAALPKGLKLLDAGAGELKWKKACAHLEYVSQDFCQYDGQGDDTGLQTGTWDTSKIDIVSDITDIPVEAESFDVVLCSEVFEHIAHPDLAIKEFARILKPGGQVLLTAPFNSLTHFAPYHFSSGFNRYWYETILEENGFEIDSITANGNYYTYMLQELDRIGYTVGVKGKPNSFLIRLGRKLLTKGLEPYFDQDDTSDLLCFGYMVKAHKKG